MDTTYLPRRVREAVAARIDAAGVSVASVANAADVPTLPAFLAGEGDLSINEIERVGGVLRAPASSLMQGAAA